MNDIQEWFAGRLPEGWFVEAPEVTVDRDEIVVVGRIARPEGADVSAAGESGRIGRFREETRTVRMQVADEAEARFGRKVAWGAVCGESRELFTNLSVPVMTRLRQVDRRVLDTLVEAGVARSRSDALAWSVGLVRQHEADWLGELRQALTSVETARSAGPRS